MSRIRTLQYIISISCCLSLPLPLPAAQTSQRRANKPRKVTKQRTKRRRIAKQATPPRTKARPTAKPNPTTPKQDEGSQGNVKYIAGAMAAIGSLFFLYGVFGHAGNNIPPRAPTPKPPKSPTPAPAPSPSLQPINSPPKSPTPKPINIPPPQPTPPPLLLTPSPSSSPAPPDPPNPPNPPLIPKDPPKSNDKLVVLKNCNPFNLPTGFNTTNIDWKNSTLDKDATIASIKKHKWRLHDPITHAKYIWPFFVAMRMLGKQAVFADNELLKILYKHSIDKTTDFSYPEELMVPLLKNTQNEPHYFHRTVKMENVIKMLDSGCIKVSKNPKPGAFVAVNALPEAKYGGFIFCLKDLEYTNLPITYWADEWSYYLGFWNDIDLRESLTHIYVEKSKEHQIPTLRQLLSNKGYNNVEVCAIPEKKVHKRYKNGITSFGPIFLPTFYPSSSQGVNAHGQKVDIVYLKKTNGVITAAQGGYKPSWNDYQELYTDKPLQFFVNARY